MDDFDFIEPKPKKRFRFVAAFFNMLTFGVVLSTLAITAYFVFHLSYTPSANSIPCRPHPITQA